MGERFLGPESSDAEIEEAIESISARLKGHGLSGFERLLMHEDRKELREVLAKRRANP